MAAPHIHQFAVTPPRGSIDQPGDCPCGTTYQQARSEAGGKENPMTDTPLTEQQLDEIEKMPRAEDIDLLVAEIRRLRAELATARSDALTAGADAIDDMEHRNAWAVRPVTASTCSEFLRGMAAGSLTSTPDTLPAWLAHRFDPRGPDWNDLAEGDQAYWGHEAQAVRRAVARNGFKTRPTTVSPVSSADTGSRT